MFRSTPELFLLDDSIPFSRGTCLELSVNIIRRNGRTFRVVGFYFYFSVVFVWFVDVVGCWFFGGGGRWVVSIELCYTILMWFTMIKIQDCIVVELNSEWLICVEKDMVSKAWTTANHREYGRDLQTVLKQFASLAQMLYVFVRGSSQVWRKLTALEVLNMGCLVNLP